MGVNEKLHRLKKHINRNQIDVHEKQPMNQTSTTTLDVPYIEEWKKWQAEPYYFDNNYSIKREVVYPLDYQHGKYRFSDILHVHKDWQERKGDHPLSTSLTSIHDMVFFDTETTGLHGGTGTYIFLLGYAKFEEDKVIVKQHFLPDPSAEVALYHGFLTDIGEYMDSLASYNGKAFDWPQVRTRHTLVRNEVPKLPSFGHFDLLHAARRLFRHRLSSCKLSIVEKEILEVYRQDDTPGYLAPMLYFDFLKESHPEYIEGVLSHNEWDVLSLITLYIDLSKRVLAFGTNKQERMEIGKWFAYLHEWAKAEWCFKKVLEETVDDIERSEYSFRLAHMLKKQKKDTEALGYYEQSLHYPGPYQFEAAIELAKHYEHRDKDLERALRYVQHAECLGTKGKDDTVKRKTRLQRKLTGAGK